MTGVIAGCLTGLGVAVLVFGTVACLVVADVPAAVLLAFGLGPLALAGAWALAGLRGLRRRFRSRPLAGWRLTSAALSSAALGFASVAAGFRGSAAGAAVLAVLALSLAARCAVAARAERSCPLPGLWTEQDEAILRGDLRLAAWKQAGQAGGGERR